MKFLEKINANVAKVNPYQPGRPIEDVARELGLDPHGITKLASNESALGVAPSAIKAIEKFAAEAHRYPDGGAFELRQKICEKFSINKDEVIFGSGSNEILVFLAQTFMGEGRSVVASEKAFIIYKILSLMTGTDFIEVPMQGLTHDLDALAAAIRPDTSIVFVCNPNNPTGSMVGEAEIDVFMEKVPEDVLVVFDEAYAEICLGDMPDTLKYFRNGRAVMTLRTFSKAYGLAGLRVGFGIGSAPVVQALEKVRQPFNTTLIGQKAALAALDDEEFIKDSREVYAQGRQLLEDYCDKNSLTYEKTFANFMLIKTGNGVEVTQQLTERGVIVRPMAGYGLAEWIRVSFGTMVENEKFCSALDDITI
ncbi:MAG: histidinol-phosphate transaminase [Lentisphaeraceae bacterium]|nr:histidinol-phosphate transaminase [Lentisphaeraceae bacterium]